LNKSKGHVEFIDGYEYFKVDARLYRARASKPLVAGKRPGEFVTAGSGINFALQMARLQAGKSE
jgi:hypothetical protein